jgi:23S rRNA pseudouridine1911/1915/1917 synthase
VWIITEDLVGERVDVAASRLSGLTRSRISELVEINALTLNSHPVAKSRKVSLSDVLEIQDMREKTLSLVPRLAPGTQIVYDDDALAVVDKPAGVAAHPAFGWEGPTVVEHLIAVGIQISTSGDAWRQGIVQRLDAGTSGLMAVAKNEAAYTGLKTAFAQRTVRKIYHTLVSGELEPSEGVIDAPIGRHPGNDFKMAVVSSGRYAITEYSTIEKYRSTSLLRIQLLTGRTHQIRVHMLALKHPCVGDPVYGGDKALAAKIGLTRQWLHAVELGFTHPITGAQLVFASPYPPDLAQALAKVER